MVHIDSNILCQVAKPARYTGGEWNAVHKNHDEVELTFALALPDVYEVGMSHLGIKILYHILNQRQDCVAERVFAPWVDMEEQMRSHHIPLYTLESFTEVSKFDVVGFTLQYEMSYTNILNMLDLAGIPLLTAERSDNDPFVIGGGPCAFNAEPLADFFDFFVLGESEEAIEEVADILAAWKREGRPGGRSGCLKRLAVLEGVYVPAFYDVSYHEDGTIAAVTPKCLEAKPAINKRVIQDMETAPYPTAPVVPYLDIVHDRIMLELFRGCTRGCRFCQAGVIYRPVRERRPETLVKLAEQLVENTGYNEISLMSLSSADYSCLHDLIKQLVERMRERKVSVSLPSLRIDSFSIQLANEVQQVRKTGLTFAPEAGTQRMRDVINKGVTEENLKDAVGAAFRSGWSTVKLYFMIGLPTETDEDIKGIADLAYKVLDLYKEIKGRRGCKVTVSVSSFVPKPHTAFQWFAQNSVEEIRRKQQLLRSCIKDRSITYNYHDSEVSFLEGVFARGDRRLGRALLEAWRLGARFDGWSEYFKLDIWMKAFANTQTDPYFYAQRDRELEEKFPWEHLNPGVDKSFLWQEYKRARTGDLTQDCRRQSCGGCGVCQGLGVDVIDWGGMA